MPPILTKGLRCENIYFCSTVHFGYSVHLGPALSGHYTVHFGYSVHLGPALSGHYIRLATISDLNIIK